MNDLDMRVRQAFDDVTVPDDVKRSALSYIACVAEATDRAPASESSAHSSAAVPAAPAAPETAGRLEARAPRAKRARGRIVPFRRMAVALAACLALVAVGFGGFAAYAQPTTYVGIDVNPSLELGVNRFGIVVEAEALNDDGRTLLDEVSLTGHGYADALALLTQSAAFAPYAQESSFVEISVTSDDDRQAEDIRRQSNACLDALPCRGTCHAVDGDTREAAASAGMGVGRYRAALELMELDPDMTLEECANLSMRELRDRIAALSPDGNAQDSSDEHESEGSHGQSSGRESGGEAGEHRHRQGEGRGNGAGANGANANG